jgi:Na+(H+)/acetate symporter ActP
VYLPKIRYKAGQVRNNGLLAQTFVAEFFFLLQVKGKGFLQKAGAGIQYGLAV